MFSADALPHTLQNRPKADTYAQPFDLVAIDKN
jgi:hypothetical protein